MPSIPTWLPDRPLAISQRRRRWRGSGCHQGGFGGIRPRREADRDAFDLTLEAATLIAQQLCREAHWDQNGRFCNWMGRSPLEMTVAGTIVPAAAAPGPELYSGSAGIGLFLAQFSRFPAMPRAAARRSERSPVRSGLPGISPAVSPRRFRCSWASSALPTPPGASPH